MTTRATGVMNGNGRPTAAERLYMDKLRASGALDADNPNFVGLGMTAPVEEGQLYVDDPGHPKWRDPNHPSWALMSAETIEEDEDICVSCGRPYES